MDSSTLRPFDSRIVCFATLLMALRLALPASSEAQSDTANLVLHNGKIVTMDRTAPVVEAVAVRGDRILAVGSDQEIRRYVGPHTQVLDLQGQLAIPGLIEGHGHFLSLGQSKMILDLSQAASWQDIVSQVASAAQAAAPGRWIVGRGWHQDKWTQRPSPHVNGYPTHHKLSEVTREHPVLLTHGTGHMVFANAKAMELAGITRDSKAPPGGEILRDQSGAPCGVFRENAMQPLRQAYASSQSNRTAKQVQADRLKAVQLATRQCLAHGVTSFQDAGASFADVRLFKHLAASKQLDVRLWVMLSENNDALQRSLADYRLVGFGNHFLTVRAIKRMIDGALGTHGAWLLQPYDDLPSSQGLNTTSTASIRRTAQLALQHDFQMCVHAIGDRANRETLDIFESVTRSISDRDLRWRIEHAQHLHPADIGRFKTLGVIASMQGVHCTSDAPFVIRRLGYRRAKEGAYVWQSLLQSGAVVINGTDAPVERLSPVECFYATVTRKLPDGLAFFPEQTMTRQQALRSYTLDAAYAAFEDHLKGSLTAGKLADIVVLSQDLLSVPEEDILQTQVLYTIVGGRIRFARPTGVPQAD